MKTLVYQHNKFLIQFYFLPQVLGSIFQENFHFFNIIITMVKSPKDIIFGINYIAMANNLKELYLISING